MKLWKNENFENKLAVIGLKKEPDSSNELVLNYIFKYNKLSRMRFIDLLVRRNKTKPKNQELYFATILYPTYTVGIITKCEGVHFYTRVDISKLVVHEKFTWENFLL